MEKIIQLEQERMKKLTDLPLAVEFFFKEPKYDAKILIWKKSDQETICSRLKTLIKFYDTFSGKWSEQGIEQASLELIAKENLANGSTLWPMRVALSGREASPGPFAIAGILGKEETVKRLKTALDLLCEK
ncbi:MAG: hypothetical protein AAB666_01150 [Patescibacteria group bacterium]